MVSFIHGSQTVCDSRGGYLQARSFSVTGVVQQQIKLLCEACVRSLPFAAFGRGGTVVGRGKLFYGSTKLFLAVSEEFLRVCGRP